MEHIIKAIEEKMENYERTIFMQKYDIENLQRKLEEAERTIESQSKEISDLKKGASA